MNNNKSVLLLGSRGQLGREINISFKQKKIKFKSIFQKSNIINKIKKEISKEKTSLIINCIAYTDVEKAESDKKKSLDINYKFVKKLSNLCEKKNIILIHFSTDYVYDGKKKMYYESNKCKPLNFYGYTKMLGDQELCKKKNGFFIFRISWLISDNKKSIIYKLYRKIIKEKIVNVIHDNFGHPTSAKFVARFITKNIKKFHNLKISGIYHLTNIGFISWYDLAKEIKKNLRKNNLAHIKKISYKKYFMKAKRPIFSKLSIKKTNKYFNYDKISWKDEVRNIMYKI